MFKRKLMKNVNRTAGYISGIVMLIIAAIFISNSVYAHVTVKPDQVGVGMYQTFNVSVPNEKDNPTVGLRLVIPAGLEHVLPNVKPGWNIEIRKAGESMKGPVLNNGMPALNSETVTEIVWTGGFIGVGMRDDFFFSAKTPAEPGELQWKAYQTYSDGTIVAWDLAKDDSLHEDDSNSGPYSITRITDDLAEKAVQAETEQINANQSGNLPLYLSVLAVILAGLGIGIALRNRS